MTTASFRSATRADAADITRFQLSMARETEELHLDPDVCAAGVLGVFEDPSRGRYFVAESEGRIAGALLITYEWSDWRNGQVWWIQSVYVPP